jgi:methylthioribose-1-phosphate isomerase
VAAAANAAAEAVAAAPTAAAVAAAVATMGICGAPPVGSVGGGGLAVGVDSIREARMRARVRVTLRTRVWARARVGCGEG